MKQNYLLILLLITIALITNNSSAIVMDELYIAELPATEQSVTARQTLILTALKQMLFKLTGNDQAFTTMQTTVAKEQIEKYVSSFSYIEQVAEPLKVKIIFNESMITSWLQDCNLPYLNKTRPVILTWLLIDKGAGFQLIGEDDQALMLPKLEQLAAEHAIPLVLPLLDLAERNEVRVTDLLNNATNVLQEAITKYNADAVLIGKLMQVAGAWQVTWNILGMKTASWELTSHSIDELYAQLIINLRNHLMQDLTGKSATAPAINVMKIKVSGIDSIDRYAKILEYLRGLKIVSLVKVIAISGKDATFELNIRGDREIVTKAISLDRFLEQAITLEDGSELETNLLHYRVRL